MEENTSVSTNEQPIQPAQPPIPSTFFTSNKTLLLGIGIGMLVTTFISGGIYLTTRDTPKQTTSNSTPNSPNSVTSLPSQGEQLPKKDTVEETNGSIKEFTDPRIEGMKFTYDSGVWEVSQLTHDKKISSPNHSYLGLGVLVSEKQTGGSLLLQYRLTDGVGGGIRTLKPGEITSVKDKLSRVSVFDQNISKKKYIYGMVTEEIFINFVGHPDEQQKALDICEAYKKEGGYQVFTDQECSETASGAITGYIEQPSFSWSLKLNRLVDLERFSSYWKTKEDVDKGKIILESEYVGENPSEADKIISQLPFIL